MSTDYGYVGFYKGKRAEVYASSSYEASKKLAVLLKAKKTYEVSVVLAEKDGEAVENTPTS